MGLGRRRPGAPGSGPPSGSETPAMRPPTSTDAGAGARAGRGRAVSPTASVMKATWMKSDSQLSRTSEDPERQLGLAGLFLSVCLVTVLGNLLIILAISPDSHLHTPMYFFLSNLSLPDISFTSTTVPKMIVDI
uniref:G-protein coupled receptors family 1 profile domain-containing protein n=1 Tax=Pongo abelii TaxID=9601 RepID=A0A8I5UJT1_PONAB